MSRVNRLLEAYSQHISIPWRDDAAPSQRVIFCVYRETDELRLRAKVEEFELSTQQVGHDWALFNLTNSFADWLGGQRYAKSYYEKPEKLKALLPRYLDYLQKEFQTFLQANNVQKDTVVALLGVGSLFGFHKVKGVVDRLAPLVPGRLVVFFPGSYEENNYRLLDGYDGWKQD